MNVVCPTVTTETVDEYREQMETAATFASRIHIDLGDGDFTSQLIGPADVWWPKTVSADVHLMHHYPLDALRVIVQLKPTTVILHAEAKGDLMEAITYLRAHTINVGIALLQATSVETAHAYIEQADHVMIFSGSLGSFGGHADLSLLGKVPQIKAIKPDIEIGWDGGVSVDNIRRLCDGGVDVLNVGGAIQKALQPENAYRDLMRRIYD